MIFDLAQTQQAGIFLPIILGIGLALLAALLFKPKAPGIPLRDDKPTTATQRGAFIPLVIGTRQVGAVVLWVGGRIIVQESTGSVGGKGFGGGGQEIFEDIFYEQGVHALAVGPGARIKGIYANGELLPGSEGLNKLTAPSGTSITFGNKGTARIYWGEPDQPISSMFTEKLGIATRVPFIIRVEWDRFRLGRLARWPIIEYVVEPVPSACVDITIDPIIEDSKSKGINPAHAMWQLLSGDFPWGGGLNTDWLDFQAFNDLAALAVTENVGMNILIQDGDPVDKVLGEVMQDFGVFLPVCQGILAPFAMRKFTDTIEPLTDDLLLPPVEEIEKIHKSLLGDALIYQYADASQKYRTVTIDIDDDTVGAIRNQRKSKKITLPTITHRRTASIVVNRRSIEDLDNVTVIKVIGLRGLRNVVAGQPFTLAGIGVVRVLSSKVDFESPKVDINLIKDLYDRELADYVDPDLPDQDPPVGDLEPDLRFIGLEIPALISAGQNLLAIMRIRANQSIVNAHILASVDDISYDLVGEQTISSTGGILETTWRTHRLQYINLTTSLRVTIDDTGDETSIPNLAALPTEWIRGDNLMVVYRPTIVDAEGVLVRPEEWEVFYVQNFSQVSGNVYEATGIIVNRMNTQRTPLANRFQDHDLEIPSFLSTDLCEIYIVQKQDLTPGSGGIVQLGGVKHVKSQPVNAQGTLPAGAIIPFSIDYTSESIRPLRIAWAQTGGDYGHGGRSDLLNEYSDDPTFNEDLVIEWMLGDVVHGAGTQGAGQVTPDLDPSGNVYIDIYFAATTSKPYLLSEDISDDANIAIVHTEILTADTVRNWRGAYEWRYTRAARIADGLAGANNDHHSVFGIGNPDFKSDQNNMQITIRHNISGVFGDPIHLRPVELIVASRTFN